MDDNSKSEICLQSFEELYEQGCDYYFQAEKKFQKHYTDTESKSLFDLDLFYESEAVVIRNFFSEALIAFNSALKLNRNANNFDIYEKRARINYFLDRDEDAIKDYTIVINNNHNTLWNIAHRIITFLKLKNGKKAVEDFMLIDLIISQLDSDKVKQQENYSVIEFLTSNYELIFLVACHIPDKVRKANILFQALFHEDCIYGTIFSKTPLAEKFQALKPMQALKNDLMTNEVSINLLATLFSRKKYAALKKSIKKKLPEFAQDIGLIDSINTDKSTSCCTM